MKIEVETKLSEVVKGFASSFIEKTNLFVLLQGIWLIEFYVLSFFAGKIGLEVFCHINVRTPVMVTK